MSDGGPRDGETLDAIGEGEIRLLQRADGYRFNLDAVLLAEFALRGREPSRALSAIDLGTGCGVVALLLKARRPGWQVTGLELQPTLLDLARRNALLNGLDVRMLGGDLRETGAEVGSGYDLVVTNPPYFAADSGHQSPRGERAAARHDGTAPAPALAKAAKKLLKSNGAACFVYGAGRLPVLFAALDGSGLVPTRMRTVHPKAEEPAGVVLVEARPSAKRPLVVEAPLVVHHADGAFGPEVRAMLSRGGN